MYNNYKSEEPSNLRYTVRPKNTTGTGLCLGIDSHLFLILLPLYSSVNGLGQLGSLPLRDLP